MVSHKDLITEIEDSPDGPEIAAFFDFDGTLIAGFSVTKFMQERITSGRISPRETFEQFAAAVNFGIGRTGFSALMASTAQFMKGLSEQSFREFGEEVYEKHLASAVYPESRAIVEAHQKKGHTVAIVSSATRYQVEPAARDLGIEDILCTELVVEDGIFTGDVVRPTCWGQGKRTAAEGYSEIHGADMDESFFYTDSHDDLPLLEVIGYPRILNPSSKLAAVAARSGWPVVRFRSRGTPGLNEIVRTIAANSAMVPSAMAGLPILALTGSLTEARNFTTGLWADYTSAIAGLKVDVKDEKHLWSHRPAVFIFNHQSNADAIIMAKLLRRDIAGVGKKEIADNPIMGALFRAAGTVLIDRKNKDKAIEAMQPLVDAMKVDGKSVVIAPEGTRSASIKLGPFKKGAFHLAIQAGVPIVPVVIHNTHDFWPKGHTFIRPTTVNVTVLPPIDTGAWSAETLDQHIDDVRRSFLRELGQEEKEKPARKKKPAARAKSTAAKTKTKAKSTPRRRAKKPAPAKQPQDNAAPTTDEAAGRID